MEPIDLVHGKRDRITAYCKGKVAKALFDYFGSDFRGNQLDKCRKNV
jgi:hypothetical protein